MAIETTANYGALIQSQVQQLLIQPLQQASTFLAAGPVIFDSASPVRLPRAAATVGAGFVAEGAQIPDASVAIDEIDLLPSTRASIKALVKFTNEMLRQSVLGLDAVLRQRLVNDVAVALDNALFNGDGTNNTITGIFHQVGTQTGTLSTSGAYDPDSLLDALATAAAANVTPNRWFFNPADYTAFRKLRATSSDGRYLFDPDVHAGPQLALWDIPVTLTNHVPAGKAILVDMNYVAVVRDVDSSVFLLDQLYGDYDSQAIRTVTRYDMGLTQPHAVVILSAA
jgi:HK97 family phage major capsid protein